MRSGLELAGRYRLEAPLGQGGMGDVWRGMDQRLRRPVAVKILLLSASADGAGVARFRREAEIAAALNHPGITTVFDIDEHTDGGLHLLFLVMELMRGRDLASVLHERPGGLPLAQVTDWAAQILDALSAAHRHGVVHRDIKPANLFLTDDGWVKVCDFGISRLADATKITATGSSAGTPLYMAPEQIEGRTVDERTDLYAFGCVLYQMLTGTTWVDTGSGVGAVLYQHLNQIPAPPHSVRPDIDDRLSSLVLDLLAKRPDDRPKDAATVAERLRGPDPRPSSSGGPAAPRQIHPERRSGDTLPPAPQTAGRPTMGIKHGGGTATAAIALALLCLLGLLVMILQVAELLLRFPGDAPVTLLLANLAVSVVEGYVLAKGALLLFRQRTAGRWMIAATGGVVAVHGMSASAQYLLTGGRLSMDTPASMVVFVVAPLTAVVAAAAMLMAVLPSTGRWCLRRS
ncbi:serine/threonine-protein kinase [Nonomuraea sp. bgisy101]|uniref:serine/threonine-protein kinase n=1 Tax=Nonomuraea sp. bgisy101 TaxID=3413784 RepID=UPI003D72C483